MTAGQHHIFSCRSPRRTSVLFLVLGICYSAIIVPSFSSSDVPPDAPLDASLHSSTPTFPRNLAVWCCFVAVTDSPCWAPSSTTHAVRGGHCPPVAWPLLRLVVEPAGASALLHLPGELRSPCCLLPICGRLHFAVLRTGLFASSERQWKETAG